MKTPSDLGATAVDTAEKRRQALRAQADDVADRQNEYGSGRPDGAKRRPRRPKGNAREAILRRLRRDHPELHALVLNGEIAPFAAAVAAGFRRRPGRQPKRPVDPSDITRTQEMELWLGAASDSSSSFAGEEERRRLWLEHRDRLLGYWGQNGRRPQAWWQYDSPIPFPGPDIERSTLFEANLLAEGERAELLKYWRQQFERRLLDPDFSLAACEAHIQWCDLPRSLLAQWATEYLKKGKAPQRDHD